MTLLRTGAAALLVAGFTAGGQSVAQAAPAPSKAAGAAAATSSIATPAPEAKPPLIPIATFAQRELFTNPVMSPDGGRVAVYVSGTEGSTVHVLDSITAKSVAVAKLGSDIEYGWHRWAGRNIVLISVSQLLKLYGEEYRASRLVALKVSTGQKWLVGPRAMGVEGDDLLHVAEDGSSILLSFQESIYEWPSVTRISLLDPADKGKEVQSPVDGIWEWFADDQGLVRMGTGWQNSKLRILYRKTAEDRFREVARIREDDKAKFWDVSRIIGGSDEAYVIDEDDQGRRVLSRYNLATRQRLETIYRNDKWDVNDAWLDDSGKPYAIDFTDDRDRRVWLEPAMAKLQRQLETALKVDEVWIGSRAKDKSRMLVYAGGEADPGGYFIYDTARRALDPFANLRPDLTTGLLARPRAVSYTARDGTSVAGYLTLPRGRAAKGLPLIIMPHGGPYGVRDKLSYDDGIQMLANRGYAVLQPNYRGSSGYGSAFEDKGEGQIGRAMQDDIDDAMDWAVKEGIADKSRVCVVGASYGGYAAMWAVLRNPERYRCAASFAGVTDWKKILKYDAKFFRRQGAKKWTARVAGDDGFNLDSVAPSRTIGGLKRPLLVAHGKRDTTVPFSQFTLLLAEAKRSNVSLDQIVFDEAGHGFDTPADEERWLSGLEAFLKKNNPAD